MTFLKVILILVEVLCSLLLIGVVLLQKSKGEGLGMAFGAEMGESLFGARAANVLVKITIWLGIIFMLNTVFLAKIYSQGQGRSVMERVAAPAPAPAAPNAAAPAGTTPETTLPAPVPAPISVPAAPVAAPEMPAPSSPAADMSPASAPPAAPAETAPAEPVAVE